MENVIDSVRRIVSKWVNTIRPLTVDADIGDDVVLVNSTNRFAVNDQVMIKDALVAETGFRITQIIDENRVRITPSVSVQNWTTDQNAVLVKTINDMFIQGVYFGDPEVIPSFPAVAVFGSDRSSEWLTLESTTERYELQINVYVLESTHEDGHRFLHQITDTIQKGLKKNIYPLVGDFETTGLKADIITDDIAIKVEDSSIFTEGNRILIEDAFRLNELHVREIVDSETIIVWNKVCESFSRDDTSIIAPTRFFYNSWPARINFGKIHKGDLLQAATINWFALEEEFQLTRRQDPALI